MIDILQTKLKSSEHVNNEAKYKTFLNRISNSFYKMYIKQRKPCHENIYDKALKEQKTCIDCLRVINFENLSKDEKYGLWNICDMGAETRVSVGSKKQATVVGGAWLGSGGGE